MKDYFMYVLENYPNADLSKKNDRELIAESLTNFMIDHHVVAYTDLEAAKKDPKMLNWIKDVKNKNNDNQMDLPFEKGL